MPLLRLMMLATMTISSIKSLIINKVPEDTKTILRKVLDLNTEINFIDWNDWCDFYEDDSDSGLMSYMKDLFEL